ncbi:MAG: Asp-tRNA(Asn)/Glu-tRNA(Gln) amidotransferase subunit GatB [Candidatus Pacebacteria bacterium]|nr:Asp-tRNA(Asn)/Glu-tRNA(Gln) amidotransferase subunit GatB [Candidatus Paceibacterota bacterium]
MLKTTIGLEIHFEAKTRSKMFCSCPNEEWNALEEKPNTNICPICTGQPGTLPVINEEAINKILMTGLALNCEVAPESKFDRKNYFYPDLPKGYQISQYDLPLCKNGYLDIISDSGETKRIRINRVHMEEDTAKLYHSDGKTLVDFNRAGVPLIELVTEPDINSAEEAKKFCQELQLILKHLDVSGANMEKGQMRCEVNISLSKDENLGTKVEIKNLNSFKTLEKSIECEIKRQSELLSRGEKVIQETRGWDDDKGITVSQREKESAHEYRYFPEPDLPPLTITEEKINLIKSHMPELPEDKRKRFEEEYCLEDPEIFVRDPALGEYFEKAVSEAYCWAEDKGCNRDKKEISRICANYLATDLQYLLKNEPEAVIEKKITPENFGEFVCLIAEGKISSKIAKIILEEMYNTGKDPSHIIEDRGLVEIRDEGEIEKIVKEVIKENEKAVEDYKKGKENSFTFLVGQVMAKSKGKANPQKAGEMLKKELGV